MFDSILRSLLGGGQQAYGPQPKQQPQMANQQQPSGQFQIPSEWLALTMANSGESWSDTLAKAAMITNERQKRDNENYEFQMKQQQMLQEQQRAETLAKSFEAQGNNQMANLLRSVDPKRPDQAAALFEATNLKPQWVSDPTKPQGGSFIAPPSRGNNPSSSPNQEKQNIDEFIAQKTREGMSQEQLQRELTKKFPKEVSSMDEQQIPLVDLSQESEHERKLRQEADAKIEATIGDEVSTTSDLQSSIKLADKTLDKVETGILAPAKVMSAKIWDETLGHVIGKQSLVDVKKAELLQSLFNEKIIPLVKKLPGALNTKELDFLKASTNTLSTSREGNREMLDKTRALLMKADKYVDLRKKYYDKNHTYKGFDVFWKDYQKISGLDNILTLPREDNGGNSRAQKARAKLAERGVGNVR